MSYQGRFGGGRRGGNDRFWRGGGNSDSYEVSEVIPLGYYTHECQGDLICKVEIEDIPMFNANIYLQNKQQIGKIDEIFGRIRDYYISVRLKADIRATSFQPNQKIYIDPMKILPLKRFLPATATKPGSGRRGSKGWGNFRGGSGRGGGGRLSFGRGRGGRPSFGKGRGGRPSF